MKTNHPAVLRVDCHRKTPHHPSVHPHTDKGRSLFSFVLCCVGSEGKHGRCKNAGLWQQKELRAGEDARKRATIMRGTTQRIAVDRFSPTLTCCRAGGASLCARRKVRQRELTIPDVLTQTRCDISWACIKLSMVFSFYSDSCIQYIHLLY